MIRATAAMAFLLALLLPALADEGKPVVVPLKSGETLRGRLVEGECSEESLVIRDIRSGQQQEIPWDRIDPKAAKKIRIDLGFEAAETEDSLLVDAVELTNKAGVTFPGKLLNAATAEKDGLYRLKTANGVLDIRVADVREGPKPVQVNALAIYTPRELYDMRVKASPPQTAEEQFRLAEYCRNIGALEEAKVHYKATMEAPDNRYSADAVQRLVERVDKRLGQKEAESALLAIRQAIVFNNFPKAAKLIEDFRGKYTDEDLLKDALDLESESKKKRDQYFAGLVAGNVREAVRDLIEKRLKAKEEKDKPLTLREMTQFAGGPVSTQTSAGALAVAATAQKLGLTPEETLAYWEQRNMRTLQKAFFRSGTFLVIQNLKDALASAPKPKPSSGTGGRQQRKPVGGGPKPHPRMTPDQWWKEMRDEKKVTELRDFLYAVWAEKSGMCELIEPKDEDCPVCGGNGYVSSLANTPEGTVPFYDRCTNCHEATFWRVVRFH